MKRSLNWYVGSVFLLLAILAGQAERVVAGSQPQTAPAEMLLLAVDMLTPTLISTSTINLNSER